MNNIFGTVPQRVIKETDLAASSYQWDFLSDLSNPVRTKFLPYFKTSENLGFDLDDSEVDSPKLTYSSFEVEDLFDLYVEQWRDETMMLSSVHAKVMHPSYQRIIGLGLQALPLILAELKEFPDDWLWALAAISGEDAAPEGSTYQEAVAAWLKWGEDKGYI
jgi:hypothetical protein